MQTFAQKRSQTQKPKSSIFGRTNQALAPRQVPEQSGLPGQALDAATRAFMEPRFGHDFSRVRVHADTRAAQSARSINAQAYTVGSNIVFGAGRFAPGTDEGRRLLAHEMTHVVQANAAASSSSPSSGAVEGLEREARQVADAVCSGEAVPPVRASARGFPAPLRQGPEGSDKPTFGNIPGDMPGPATRVRLVEEGDVWYEQRPGGEKYRASGKYDFVTQKGKIWAVKGSSAMGAANPGHTEASAGGRVEYAGTVQFGSGNKARGTVVRWSNASGHIAPVRAFAEAAGLPMDKFVPVEGGFPEAGPQLPVFQPNKGDVLVPSGRGGDAKQLGSPKVEPVPQKTIVSGGFETNDAPKPTPAPTGPPARTMTGEMTTPDHVAPNTPTGAGVETTEPPAAGGLSKVGTTAGEVGTSSKIDEHLEGLAIGVGSIAFSMLANLVVGGVIARQQEARIKNELKALQPQIKQAEDQKQGDVKKLMQQTNSRQNIYANIHVEIIFSESMDPDGPTSVDFAGAKLTGVDVSTQNINRNEPLYRETVVLDNYDHYPFTYSEPLVETELAEATPEGYEQRMAEVADLLGAVAKDFAVAGPQYGDLNRALKTALALLGKDPTAKFQQGESVDSFLAVRSAVDEASYSWFPPDDRLVAAMRLLDSLYKKWPGAVKTSESALRPPRQ